MLRDMTALTAAGLIVLTASAAGSQPARAAARQPAPASTPADAAGLSARADAARAANRPEEAIALYRQALQARPRWAEGWFHLGTLLYDRDAHGDAAAALRKATTLDPSVGTAWVMLGLCEYHLGAFPQALAHVQRGRRLGVSADPQFRLVMRYHEGLLLAHAGEFERAQDTLDELSAEGAHSEDLDIAQGLAALRMRPGDLPPGASPPRAAVIAAGRAEGLFARKQFAEAQRAFETLAADHPSMRNVHYALGRYFVRTEQPAPAVAAFERELAVSPDHLPARLGIAAIVLQDDPTRALRLVDEAIARNPRVPLAHYLRGRLLLDRGDAAAAVPALEIAERSVKDDPGVYYALSRAYAQLGRRADADRARATFTRLNEARQAAARRTPGG
jgi:predicted Zn-dependent protease